ncbi:MAG: hypothetical protein LBK68_05260 [Candidatus Margulisbacteria bacterium]|jgi:hypothetical protein|nr:hypothetical protein [Candidatus Margulisiibacteriota bacterium]
MSSVNINKRPFESIPAINDGLKKFDTITMKKNGDGKDGKIDRWELAAILSDSDKTEAFKSTINSEIERLEAIDGIYDNKTENVMLLMELVELRDAINNGSIYDDLSTELAVIKAKREHIEASAGNAEKDGQIPYKIIGKKHEIDQIS